MDPGEGAIGYAKTLIQGKTRAEASIIIQSLLHAPPNDPAIKLCSSCGYPFRDTTRNSSALVCGASCKTARKTNQRKAQRKVKRTANNTIKQSKPIRYTWWLEYPYWTSEKWMLSSASSYEKAYPPIKIEQISATRERKEQMGGRRRSTQEIYD